VTSRPGQHGVVNAVLVAATAKEAKEKTGKEKE
jgi:hypothetical protein